MEENPSASVQLNPVIENKEETDAESDNADLSADFMVLDEITGSQDTNENEEGSELMEVIDLDNESVLNKSEEDNNGSVQGSSEKSDFLGFESKGQEDTIDTVEPAENEKPGLNIGGNETNLEITSPMVISEGEELRRIETPPPTAPVEVGSTETDFGSDLASQIQAALEKAKMQGDTTINNDDQKQSDVVELIDDEDDIPKPTVSVNGKENDQLKPVLDHDCINPKCERKSNDFVRARKCIVNHYRQNGEKLSKKQYVCSPCYDLAVEKYREYAEALINRKPLLRMEMPKREEVVELLSDGEESNDENSSDDEPLQKETLKLLNTDLESTIAEILEKVCISNQMGWTMQIINARTENNQKMLDENHSDLLALEQKANAMYRKLYSVNEVQYYNLPTLEINSTNDGQIYREKYQLPISGPVIRPPINLSTIYFAVKQRLLSTWCQCKVMDVIEDASKLHHFRVQFIDSKVNNIRVVSPKQIAYGHPPTSRLPVGERVIALFNTTTHSSSTTIPGTVGLPRQFYPGIIAEPLQPYNMFRYLIFFDDGYAQYVTPQDVRLVHEVSASVWEDVHPHSKEFIENYLHNYKKERPMVQAHKNQRIITEFKGKWQAAKVLEVDASLVRVYFQDAKKTEWIYRGSTRLAPLFKQKEMNTGVPKKRSDPSIEYVTMSETSESTQGRPINQQQQGGTDLPNTPRRAVARKSSAGVTRPINSMAHTQQEIQQLQQQRQEQREKIKFMNRNTIILDDDSEKGRVVYYTAKQNFEEKKFRPHECSPNCLFKIAHNLKMYSPTAKPLLSGWERQIAKQKMKRVVFYRAPCGRRLRNTNEVYEYLKMTNCRLGIECFDFDEKLHCLAEYVTEKAFYTIPDISNGLEGMPVPCVNSYDETKPPPCEYSANRIPTEGVNLVTDSEFMCGCDCTNDCIDKETCACQQLTLAGARFSNPNTPPEQVGYQYKRLHEQTIAGIYECNPNCKCSKKTCLNRVVQQPIQNKLQLFKTFNMGWGLRATTDIPKGTFICIYAGYLLTDEKANTDHGDEYFADLDYIELVEQLKNGYESDAQEMTDPESDYDPNEDSPDGDRDFRPSGSSLSKNTRSVRSTRSSQSVEQLMERANIERAKQLSKKTDSKSTSRSGSDDEDTREMVNLMPDSILDCEDEPNSKYCSLRKLYGKNESVYVMDAKICGNIGRYFNHSCDPNMFVQNVFVDTHDLRFPWVAFFSSRYIKAGTELSWDYNYEVGSIKDKVLFCECGSTKCRIRLL